MIIANRVMSSELSGQDAWIPRNLNKISCNWKALVKVSVCNVSHVSSTDFCMLRKCITHQKPKRALDTRKRLENLKKIKGVCALMRVTHIKILNYSRPDIWFDDVDESEINGTVEAPPQKKPRRTEITNTELVTGKCTE